MTTIAFCCYNSSIKIIDMISPSDEKILWRGTASDKLKNSETPQEREAYIQKLVNALLESFPKRAAE